MNCHEFELELDRCVEEKRSPDTQVIEHAAACTSSTCSERWEEHQLLSSAIEAWASELPQVDLTDSLLRLHDQSNALDDVEVLSSRVYPRGLDSNDRFPAAMAAVVSLLVTACLLIAISFRPAPQAVAINVPDPVEEVPEQAQLEIGETYVSLVNGVTSKVAMMVPTEMNSTSAWLDMWSERVEPLEDKLDSTVRDFVKETLSDMTDSAS